MKTKKRLMVLAAFVAFVTTIGLWLLWYAPPLRPSSDYLVTYSVSGQPHSDAHLFRPVGIPSRYYISIPSPPAPRYHWFAVDFSNHLVALPSFGVTCPCGSPCVHRDQAFGLVLPDAKTEGTWKVVFAKDGVEFSNTTLSVKLTKKP